MDEEDCMKQYVLFQLIIQTILLVLLMPSEGAAQDKYQIKTIRAYFYYHETGDYSTDDLIANHISPWNSIIGEGPAGQASSATLILVEIAGPSFVSGTKGTVELKATTSLKTLLQQRIPLDTFFTESQMIVIPFFVYGTGCEKLHLTASVLTPKGGKHSRTADVAFECGE
jgi:hypothetical protein